MTDIPIIFSAVMVNALLSGRKLMTRRMLYTERKYRVGVPGSVAMTGLETYPPPSSFTMGRAWVLTGWHKVKSGDRLWVRNNFDIFPVYFKPIVGHEGVYAAGTDGLIYRMDCGTPSPLKGSPSSKGYLTVSLSNAGEVKTHSVHALICAAFYGLRPQDDSEVRHIDGDQSNNRPENLDWGTASDNWADRRRMKRGIHSEHHAAKLTPDQVEEIRSSPCSQRELAGQFDVAQSTICAVKNGETWVQPDISVNRNLPAWKPWAPSIHMPRWASRLTLIVTGAKIERLNDISEDDARAEGCPLDQDGNSYDPPPARADCRQDYARYSFRNLWASLHGAASWDANPWVVALAFKVIKANIDAPEARIAA